MNTQSLPALLRKTATNNPHLTAIEFFERTLNFKEFNQQSDRLAAWLTSRGIVKGARVGLYCINSDFFVVAYLGILKAGAVVVPLNLLLNPKEISYILQDAGARGLIYLDAFAQSVADVRQTTPCLEVFLCIGDNKSAPSDAAFTEAIACQDAAPDIALEPAVDLAAILYTAGTTGHPKGAMLSHRNLASNVASAAQALQIKPGHEKFLLVLPMFHAFAATAGMLLPLLNGCCVVPLSKFEPVQVAAAAERSKSTIFLAVPSMFVALLRLPETARDQFASLRFCISGGASLPKAVLHQFEDKFGKLIYEGDGPTECSPVTCVNPIDGKRKVGTVGLALPDVEMRIMDEAGQEKPRGEVGEICVRGPNVMRGYWKRPDDTRASFFGEWFRTGDLGHVDDEGYFTIVDRKKDLIIVNGMNVYPRVVEEVLMHHPAVREVAVVGEPHKLHGEIPVVYMSLKSGFKVTGVDIRTYCRDHLGRHEVPRKVYFMDDLPKSAAGKILKRELRRHGELERGIDLPNGKTPA